MRKLIVILSMLLVGHASADDNLYLTLPLGSYHSDRNAGYNEHNRGVGIEYQSYVAGYYKNSTHQDTFYAGYVWRPIDFGYVKAGILAGVVTGYQVPLIAVPTINIGTDNYSVDLIFAPKIKDSSAFVGASLRVKIP